MMDLSIRELECWERPLPSTGLVDDDDVDLTDDWRVNYDRWGHLE